MHPTIQRRNPNKQSYDDNLKQFVNIRIWILILVVLFVWKSKEDREKMKQNKI